MRRIWLTTLLCIAFAGSAVAQIELSYIDLIAKLTDMEVLAVLPVKGEACSQWSSYDRASRYEGDKYIDWAANNDGPGIIRREDDVSVFAEMEGPGCIWRIWTALAQGGHVKIYLDGAAEPAVDLPFIGYFNRENFPFIYPSLVHTTARGLNCYVPIPYQKSCKVVAEKGWGRYYHFTYQTFPKGTVVPTFKRELSPEETAALETADRFLTNTLGGDPARGRRKGQVTELKGVTVPAGGKVTVVELEGERAITGIDVKLWSAPHYEVAEVFPEPDGARRLQEITVRLDSPSPERIQEMLRELVLSITWDRDRTPSVWVPLGDFFGTAPGINLYRSLPLGMPKDRFYSLWYMPFAESALVELINDGNEEQSLQISITHAPLSRPVEQLGRFHAKWHRDALLPAEPERAAIDWTMLKTEGRGRYCGVVLNVWNPRGRWWGEGDEKFFVDGEKFPSTFGTGSEDYFGYAWCTAELFQNAYHNQTITAPDNRGHISVNRWHIADNVPFQRSFEGAIEKYYPNDRPTLYDCTVYWYLAPGGTDRYGPVPLSDRTGYYVEPEIFKVEGALEGETLEVRMRTGGRPRTQDMFTFGDEWSDDRQLWWSGAKPGDKLVLAFPVDKAGTYELKLQLTKAADYGIVQLSLDGTKLGDPIDLYNPAVVPTGAMSFGTHELERGKHNLTIEIVGANENVGKRYMFGLDYVKLEPVK